VSGERFLRLESRGAAQRKKGDTAGGNADIAVAKAIKPDTAAVSAGYGTTIDAADPARIR
jgi:hypothetical protein